MLYIRLGARRVGTAVAALFALGPTTATAAPAAAKAVSLITGDQVTLDSAGNAVVRPAPDRKGISFQVVRSRGHTQVVPSDAASLLRTGQLDPRLFDVTELVANGYDKRAATPVIVTGMSSADGQGAGSLVGDAPGVAGRNLALVDGVAVAATTDGSLWRAWLSARSQASFAKYDRGASKLWLDGMRKLSVEENLQQIGADVAHKNGLLGDGVKVAVIDSGIDAEHPDLEGQVKHQKNFVADEEDDRDYAGHGTVVASVIAGTGAASQGRHLGVAPHAELIDAKACTVFGCRESAILEAMAWAAERGARVINLSFGSMDREGDDLIEDAVNKLSKERGVLIVAAAGNEYLFGQPVGSPASAEAALAVGSVSAFGLPSDFSQRGRLGELAIKPELIAPGESITGARSQFMDDLRGPTTESYYTTSGTSMAAPHVSGAAALLSQRHPDWTGEKLKAVLIGSAKVLDGQSVLSQGAGVVNIPNALELQLRAEPAAISLGRPTWPHDDDKSVERKLTLHNESAEAVTVELTIEARNADGASADPEMFSLSETKLEIAAHSSASVKLIANTRVGEDGLYSGQLLATGGGQALHVPFIVEREPESYDLELRFVDRKGQPLDPNTAFAFASIVPWADNGAINDLQPSADSTATVRLPRSSYAIATHLSDGNAMTQLLYPELTLDRDQTVLLDASVAKPVQIEAPLPEAQLYMLGYSIDLPFFGMGSGTGPEQEIFTGRLGPKSDRKDYGSSINASWHAPGAPEDSEYQFHWARFFPGKVLQGYQTRTELSDYAEVDTKVARGDSALQPSFAAIAMPVDPQGASGGAGQSIPVRTPGSIRMYYAADTPIAWNIELSKMDFDAGVFDLWMESARFEAGERYEQQWNQAVFGPGAGLYAPAVARHQDTLTIAPALLADHEGRGGSFMVPDAGGRARLFRNGQLIEEINEPRLYTEVPPESARYRAELTLDRRAPVELSTHIEIAWEFSSKSTGDQELPLPTSFIRFLPELDQQSAAPSGEELELPIRIEAHPDANVAELKSLEAEVSYDDGRTWSKLDLEGEGSDWSARLEHPARSGYTSLRAAATDADDNKVELTIIRAYRLQ